MKNRKSILLIVLLLAVGFAAVSTTLYINGSTNINPNQDDFNVYYSDAYVNGTKELSVIKDDTVIEFTTTFEKLNQEYVLDYEVTNGSKNYDAELVMSCTSGNDYLTVTNEFDDETILEARESRLGKLTLVQTKSYAGSDDLDVTIKCKIDANALERTSLNESEIQTAGDYVIEGYYKDSNNNVLANANLVIFSDTPHYTTTDETGYVFYNGLERGKHEVYYVDDTLDNIKSMTKEEIISKSKTSATFTTTSDEIVFDDSTTIVELSIEESIKYCNSLINKEWNFSYTGSETSFITRCSGTYKIELWGASGGSNGVTSGGTGAYVSGDLKVLANDKLYVYVGQKGPDGSKKKNYVPDSAFNGGGHGNNTPNSLPIDNSPYVSGSGGGATDIRLVNGAWNSFDSLKSRIMVAGAGGGFGYTGSAGVGGTLSGGNSSNSSGSYGGVLGAKGGTQISKGLTSTGTTTGNSNWSMGTHGGFGYGGYGVLLTHPGGGGGAGYYGGGAGGSGGGSIGGASGAGGSSFISGHTGCDAIDETSTSSNIIHTGESYHYSGYIFTNTKMLAGNEVMPSYDGTTTMTGNAGNGYAKITYLGTN